MTEFRWCILLAVIIWFIGWNTQSLPLYTLFGTIAAGFVGWMAVSLMTGIVINLVWNNPKGLSPVSGMATLTWIVLGDK